MAIPQYDWFLRDWLRTVAMTQQQLADILDWQKSKVSRLAAGLTQYDRGHVNEISAALHIQPFELLMHPADAMALRRLKESALSIAADVHRDFTHEPSENNDLPHKHSNGTNG